MHQKDRVRKAWLDAGLYSSKDAKLQEFMARLDTTPYDCWPELMDELRRNYSDIMVEVVEPVWHTGDKLLRLNLLRYLDYARVDEVKLARRLIATANPATDAYELKSVLLRGTPSMVQDVAKMKHLTPELAAAVQFAKASAASTKSVTATGALKAKR